MPRHGKYLFRRKGSNNWWLRFQYTGKLAGGASVKKEFSLGTSDKLEAEILAAPHIKAHKLMLMAARNARKGLINNDSVHQALQYEPNKLHYDREGRQLFASESTLFYLDKDGSTTSTAPNETRYRVIFTDVKQQEREIVTELKKRQKSADDDVIETWIKHRNINHHIASEARRAWEVFKEQVGQKPLSKCNRDDGRELAHTLLKSGNKRQTVLKKIGHLCAAVNLAVRERRLEYNPFLDVVPHIDDALKRHPLDDDDMQVVRNSLDRLSENDQLLWIMLASTGMRLGEPFQIERDEMENGVRFVYVGTKTESSFRRVPLPDSCIERLPPRITSKLFSESPETVAKRLRYFLRTIGISYHTTKKTGDKRKVVHSLRHRAKDKLRAALTPLEIQYELLGHEVVTVAQTYGRGHPVPELKKWIEKIGY